MAVGAQPSSVLGMVIKNGLRLSVAGAVIGALGAAALTHSLQSMLFEISAYDVPTFLGTALILILISIAACLAPAIRATRIDPLQALRAE